MDQPGHKVVNPARGQLSRENEYFPVSVRAEEFGLARQIRPSRFASACTFSTLRLDYLVYGRPGSSEVPRNPLTRWDVSSIPANGIFLTKKLKNKIKNAQRVENDQIVGTQNSTSRSTRERNG